MMKEFSEPLSRRALCQLSEMIASRVGLHFPEARWRELERGICSIARDFEFDDVESCIRWLLSSSSTQPQIEALAIYLTVGETYFFRDPQSFDTLAHRILPSVIKDRRGTDRHLKIWSAGCCTGEETYSIAILLRQVLSDLKDWQITILGTDINPRFLDKAAQGTYGEWSFRGVAPEIKERYFAKKRNGRFEVLPEIKSMVTFSHLNLVEESYPSSLSNINAVDVIFCRNVLMYFGAEAAKQVIQKFHLSLSDGGWLIVSPTETSHVLYSQFAAISCSGMIFYKKDRDRPSVQTSYEEPNRFEPPPAYFFTAAAD